MCTGTKQKIADCVIDLARKKDISKISVQDVMNATNMSRQSFYYHFKDIYDVLEWYGKNNFYEAVKYQECETFEQWLKKVFLVIDSNRTFYERIVADIPLSRLLPYLYEPLNKALSAMLNCESNRLNLDDFHKEYILSTLSKSICYEVLSYISSSSVTNSDSITTSFSTMKVLMNNFSNIDSKKTISA